MTTTTRTVRRNRQRFIVIVGALAGTIGMASAVSARTGSNNDRPSFKREDSTTVVTAASTTSAATATAACELPGPSAGAVAALPSSAREGPTSPADTTSENTPNAGKIKIYTSG